MPGRQARCDRRRCSADLAREERGPVAGTGAAARPQHHREHARPPLYARYQQRLAAFNAVDFDDLIRLPVQLLETDATRSPAGASASATCWSTNARTPTTRSTAC
jgi:hypothetical protein